MTDAALGSIAVAPRRASRGVVRSTARSMFRDPMAIAGLCFVALLVLVAIVGHFFAPDPMLQTADIGQPPSSEHWFGTDGLGRDLFARCAAGAIVSLQVAVGSVSIGSTDRCPDRDARRLLRDDMAR